MENRISIAAQIAREQEPPAAATSSIASQIKAENERRKQIEGKLAEDQNKRIPPDLQAKAIPLAKASNLPIDVTRRNLDTLEAQKVQPEIDRAKADAPSYAKMLQDEAHGPIAQSAIAEMPWIERVMRSYGQAWTGGFEDLEASDIGYRRRQGTATAEDIARLEELKAAQKRRTDFRLDPVTSFFQYPVGSAPATGATFARTWDEVLLGGATGVAAGAVTGPGAVGGGVAGAGIGLRVGLVKESYEQLAGAAYNEALEARDESGNPLDEDTAYAISTFAGGIGAVAELLPFEKALDTMPFLKGTVGKEGARRLAALAAQNPAVRSSLARMGRILKVGGAEAFTEVLQEALVLEGIISSGGVTDEDGNVLAEQRLDRYGGAAVGGFAGGTTLGAGGEAVTATVDKVASIRTQRAEARKQSLVELGDKIRSSKVNGMSPETVVAHAKQMDADGAAPQMSAPAEKLIELFQSEGLTAEQVQAQFPSLAASLDEAAQTGAEVTLNAETVIRLSRMENFASITDDIRTGPEELTVNEAKQADEELTKLLEGVSEEDVAKAVDTSIENQVAKQLVAAGAEPRAADTQARLFTSVIRNLAERTGMAPDELLKRYGVEIVGDGATDTAALPDATMMQSTPEFRNWFGDSKVTDESGAPRVMYRGLRSEWKDGGAVQFWANDPDIASAYADSPTGAPNVVPAYLSVNKPFILKDDAAAFQLAEWMSESTEVRWDQTMPYWQLAEDGQLLRWALERNGYDGLIMDDADGRNDHETVVTLNPTQIKSAIGNQGTFDPQDPNILMQSGNPLFAERPPIEGKVTVRAIGEAFNKDHLAKHDRQLFPENSTEDYATVLQFAKGELEAQLKEPNSGVGWYSKDVQLAIELASRVYPTLTTNPLHRDLYLTFAGLFSNGSDPDQAFMMSAEAFETFLVNGEIPVNRADGARVRGVEPKMTTFDDRKTGKKVTKEAGWGIRNQANEQQLAFVKQIVEREGSVEAGLRWMMTTHPRAEINKAMTEGGLYKAGRYTTKAEVAGPDAQGLMAFGEKLGHYTMGLHGVEIDAGDTTIDLWFTRTYRRWTGRLLETPLGKEGVAAQPTDTDRRVIFSLVGDLAKEYDLPPGDIQAVLWFFEKRLWGSQGLRTNEGTNSSGARKLLRSKGLDDGTGGDGADIGAGEEDQGPGDAEGGVTLNQTAQSRQTFARGSIRITPGRDKFQITLTGRADLSTFMHESAHYFLEVMQDLVESGDAPPQLVEDLTVLKKWMGLAPDSKAGPAQKIERRHHEQFARGFEAYLMEGRAPSNDLQSIFNRFRAWLVFIYKRMAALDVQLTGEVRGVMDRLVASDREIADARTSVGLSKPLPKEALYLSDEEYDRYVEAWNKANEEQQRELDGRLMREAAEETKAAWKEERARLIKEETEALAQTRGHRAWKLLTEGTGLEEAAPGRTSLKIDPATVPPEWRRDTTGMTDEAGLPLDTVAETLGFRSGEEMISLIADAKGAARDTARNVMRKMKETHGHMDAVALADAAMDAVHSDKTQEVLLTEYRAMAAQAGIGAVPTGMTKWMAAQAQQKVMSLTRRQLDPMRWRRAELKAAQQSAAAKDPTQAAIHKRQQMMAAAMYKATIDAQKRVDVIRRKLMPFTKNDRRAKLGKAGDLYLDGIDQILEDIQLKPMSAKAVEKISRLEKLVAEADKNGEPLVLPDKLRAMLGKKNFADMTLEEITGVHDAVMNIWHLAKLKNELKARQEKRDLEEALTEMEENARRALGDPKVTVRFTEGWKDRAVATMRGFRAGLIKMEFLFGWLDGKPDGGLMHRLIYQPIADANKAKYDILKRSQHTIIERMRDMPKEQKARWESKRTFMGNPTANGATIISAALNLGNAGNRQKLLEGYGWNEQQLMAEINAFMTKADWDFVQHVWGEIDTLWPKIEATTKAATGLAPEKVVPTPIVTPFGTYAGGYYPVVYDPEQTEQQFKNQQESAGLFSNNYARPTLGDGFTKGRVDYAAPILLQLDVISRHLAEVVHYVTHYEAVTQADKITRHPRFQAIVKGHMGNEFYRTIRPWLQDVARDQDTPAITRQEPFAKAMRHLRGGVSIAAMGYNIFTGVKQLIGIVQSLDAIGPVYWAQGLSEAWLSPRAIENWKFAFRESQELEPLVTQLDRDIKMINDAYAMEGTLNMPAKVASWAFKHIGWLQAAVNVATWRGAYAQEMARSDDHAKAVMHADAVVRQTQSAGSVKDLSPIQRGSEINRAVSMFYSWFNVLYNRLEDIARQTKSIRDVPKAAARVAILVMMSSMIEEAGRRAWEAVVDNYEEDEEEAGYILSVLLKSADTAIGAIPLARVFFSAEAAAGGMTPDLVPAAGVVDDYWRTARAAYDIVAEGEAPSRSEVKTAVRTVSILGAVPLSGPYNFLDELFGETVFGEGQKTRP
jgi:hypothetical protein